MLYGQCQKPEGYEKVQDSQMLYYKSKFKLGLSELSVKVYFSEAARPVLTVLQIKHRYFFETPGILEKTKSG